MKTILKYLNPVFFINRIVEFFKELRHFVFYVNTVDSLNEKGDLKRLNLRPDYFRRLNYIVNLKPEVLMYGEEELEKFELQFVAQEVSKLNDLFIYNQLIELVITDKERIFTPEHYAYRVIIKFNRQAIKVSTVLYFIGYSLLTYYVISKVINIIATEPVQKALNWVISLV